MFKTNVDKFLKDKVNVVEFTLKFDEWHIKNSDIKGYGEALFRFLNEQVKPTLSEDERVILRNIKNEEYKYIIGREDDTTYQKGKLYLRSRESHVKAFTISTLYNHLFQFIKERRRI